MRKLISLLLTIMMINGAYGVMLCKKTGTAVAVLNKLVGGTVESASGTRWVVNMTDGTTVKGKSLCTGMPGEFAIVNTGVADTYDTGTNCYCKLMAPATSYWVNANDTTPYETDSECESKCASACANYSATNQTFRSALYEAIW